MNNKFTQQFPDLDSLFALKGEQVTVAKRRHVIKTKVEGQNYYIKRYTRPGKGIRRFVGRSRLRAEAENLQYFSKLNIPAPEIAAFAEQRQGFFKKGALVLHEIPDVVPLNEIAAYEIFHDAGWRQDVIKKVATYVRELHQNRFVHGDLFLRNILVNLEGEVYFIDCPQGKKRFGFLLRHWKLKDLTCLYKEAKDIFTLKECLFFLRLYLNQNKLGGRGKKIVHIISKRSAHYS